MNAEQLGDYLSGRGIAVSRRAGERWASCPAHGDPTPSVSWRDGDDGRVLLSCKAGCDTRDVLEAWGLGWGDLFEDGAESRSDPSPVATETRSLPSEGELAAAQARLSGDRETLRKLGLWRGWTDTDALSRLGVGETERGRIIFPARDGDGRLVGVSEYDPNPRRTGPKSISSGKRELFPAPEFVGGDTLYVFEGEPDAVLANLIGLPAIGVPGAAYWAGTRGRAAAQRVSAGRERVYFVPDCDDAGRQWVERAATDTAAHGLDVRTLELDANATNGFDLTDLVSNGGPTTARKFIEMLARKSSRLTIKTAEQGTDTGWPLPMSEEAFIGVSGRIVRFLEPTVEADRVGLLLHLLVGFGNLIGRGPHVSLGRRRHSAVLYAVVVGRTAKARKGTAWAAVEEILESVSRIWHDERIDFGLASGEGLITKVRDPITERIRAGTGERVAGDPDPDEDGYVSRVIDPGVADKRLLVIEQEFAQPLRLMRREGNPLSQHLRTLWDAGKAATMTKHSPTKATDAHVSIIGHIVAEELEREMRSVDWFNGFANRFLFACVRRSQLLPEPPTNDPLDITAFGSELSRAAEWAKDANLMIFRADTQRLWNKAYVGELSTERFGAYGAVTARAEPYVARLSMIYALLDGETMQIRPEHLRAALAVWRYCDASARFLFGTEPVIGDAVARTMLERIPDGGIARGELRHALSHNLTTERFDAALRALVAARAAYVVAERDQRGRAIDRVYRRDA
jgi:hypothetical protein